MSGGIKLTFNYKGEDKCLIRSDEKDIDILSDKFN